METDLPVLPLVCPCIYRCLFAFLTAVNAGSRLVILIKWYHSDVCTCLFFYLGFASFLATPACEKEPALYFDYRFEALKIDRCEGVLVEKLSCLRKQIFLYLRQKRCCDIYKLFLLHMLFFLCIAPYKFNLLLFDILWSNVDAQRDSFHLPFIKLPTRSVFISVIHVCSYTSAL